MEQINKSNTLAAITRAAKMNAQANLLAISPEIREQLSDLEICRRYRIERGYEWAPAEAEARRKYEQTMARTAEIRRDAALAKATLEFGR